MTPRDTTHPPTTSGSAHPHGTAYVTHLHRIMQALTADPHRVIAVEDSATVTAAQFLDTIATLTEALGTITALKPGSVVAIAAPVCADALAVRYAAGLAGHPTVFCPTLQSTDDLADFLARTAAAALVVFADTAALQDAHPNVVSVGPVAGVTLDLLTAAATPSLPPALQADPNATYCLIASGGTTGAPKATQRSWANYAAMIDLGPCPQRRQLIATPLAYVAQTLADGVLAGGGTLVLHPDVEPREILALIARERVTHLTVVEPHLVELLACDDVLTTDLSSLHALTHVGADAAASLKAWMLTRLPRPVLVHPYATSEVSLVSALTAPDYTLDHPDLLATVGPPAPGVEVAVLDEDNNPCGPDELGEIHIHSHTLAEGYSVAPPQSGFGADGWFATGDLGSLDDRGYLHLRGRRTDRRVINGHNVFPADIQNALCRLPDIIYAVAVPAPHDNSFGAALILRDTDADPLDVLTRAHTTTNAHLIPPTARAMPAIPQTAQGQPDRTTLTQLLWQNAPPQN